jgi:acetyl esterase
LIYPITDCDFERPSYRENCEGYFLTRSEMDWFWNLYLSNPDQMREPYASPMRAESLKGLPPALIQTAEFDPLRDEGEAYAAALRSAGIEVKLHRFDGMIHAFMKRIQFFDAASESIREVGEALKSAIGH